MHPNCYPAAIRAEWGVIPANHPAEDSAKYVGQFHSEAVTRVKVDGFLRLPVFLSVATCVLNLRDHNH